MYGKAAFFGSDTLAFAEKNEFMPVRKFVCASVRISAFLQIVEKPQFFNERRQSVMSTSGVISMA